MTPPDHLTPACHAPPKDLSSTFPSHFALSTNPQELEAALTKRRAGAKRRIAALQAEGDALLADARSRIQRRRKRAGKLPQLAALLKQFV
jgi:hypothetical protein